MTIKKTKTPDEHTQILEAIAKLQTNVDSLATLVAGSINRLYDSKQDMRQIFQVMERIQTAMPKAPPTPGPVTYALNNEEMALVRNKEIVKAIIAHRNRTGQGLKDSKDTVDAWARGADLKLNPEERRQASIGNFDGKIDAIKSYRARTGSSLREAKDAVENWMFQNSIPYKSP